MRSRSSRAEACGSATGRCGTFSISFEECRSRRGPPRSPSLIVAARRMRRLQGGLFGRQYEYEEDLYLALDGSATLVVNASVPALVALRGSPARPRGDAARSERHPRRVRVAGADVTANQPAVAAQRPPLRPGAPRRQGHSQAESRRRRSRGRATRSRRRTGMHVFEQKVGASALRPGTLQNVGWNGSELVAFRLHLPSRIIWHNSRDLETGSRAAPRAATSWRGSSTSPIGSREPRSTSASRWTASRSCTDAVAVRRRFRGRPRRAGAADLVHHPERRERIRPGRQVVGSIAADPTQRAARDRTAALATRFWSPSRSSVRS